MSTTLIKVEGDTLYAAPTAENPEGGVLYRVSRRCKARNQYMIRKFGREITYRERRNMMIGEIGEAAVALDWANRGYTVIQHSWDEFRNQRGNESSIDMRVMKGSHSLKIQVKASEAGNRRISDKYLRQYQRDGVQAMVFVAVREGVDEGGVGYFECQITSQISPMQIPNMASWVKDWYGWMHVDNKAFIEEWTRGMDFSGTILDVVNEEQIEW